ncbi:MAG TPA: hypothetical protein VFT12_04115 [Thermoanaerobaculia bacterium]|nr:hypothetical protein [Thermoanaerobaculia bacterium]
MTGADRRSSVSVAPLVVVVAGPLLALLLWTAVSRAAATTLVANTYLMRLEAASFLLLAGSAAGVIRSAKRVSPPVTSATIIGMLVACAIALAIGKTPGSLFASVFEAVAAILVLATVTAAAVRLGSRRWSHALFAFWSVLFCAAVGAAWAIAVHRTIASLIMRH